MKSYEIITQPMFSDGSRPIFRDLRTETQNQNANQMTPVITATVCATMQTRLNFGVLKSRQM